MQIKRFAARNMSEALQMVKAELGPEAIILSARSVKRNGSIIDAFRKPGVEVTAAKDTPRTNLQQPSARYIDRYREYAGLSEPISNPRAHPPSRIGAADGRTDLNDGSGRQAVRSDKDGRLRDSWLYRHLIRQDVRAQYALEIASDLLAASPENGADNENLLTALNKAIQVLGVETRPMISAAARRVAFVGPAGAGKTTSTAKIAAAAAMQSGRKVAMVSFDNYRIAAVDQLHRCAEIIGIPLVVTDRPDELKQMTGRLHGCDLILIDTPAIRRSDEQMLEKLGNDLKRAAVDEIHFVCSASRKERDTVALFQQMDGIAVNRLLFTKLDETATYGNMLNLLIDLQIPASGFSSGQQIPASLKGASIAKLSELILNGRSQAAASARPGQAQSRQKAPGSRKKSAGGRYTANKNSYLFHTADCIWTRLIKKENRVFFNSTAEALARKFKPCRDCCKNITELPGRHRRHAGPTKVPETAANGRFARGISAAGRPGKIPVRSA